MQPWGSTFQNGFFGEAPFERFLKKLTFEQKSGVVSKKDPKNWTFETTWEFYSHYQLDTVSFSTSLH